MRVASALHTRIGAGDSIAAIEVCTRHEVTFQTSSPVGRISSISEQVFGFALKKKTEARRSIAKGNRCNSRAVESCRIVKPKREQPTALPRNALLTMIRRSGHLRAAETSSTCRGALLVHKARNGRNIASQTLADGLG